MQQVNPKQQRLQWFKRGEHWDVADDKGRLVMSAYSATNTKHIVYTLHPAHGVARIQFLFQGSVEELASKRIVLH